MTRQAIRLLKLADPVPHLARPSSRSKQRRQVSRVAAVGMALSIAVGASAATVSAQTLIANRQVATTSAIDIHDPVSTSDEPTVNVNDPSIRQLISTYVDAYPLPPGASKTKVYQPILDTFPLAAGTSFWTSVKDHPLWVSYFADMDYVPATGDTPETNGIPVDISQTDLVGTIALAAINAWYRYWLTAPPAERQQAQPTLDNMQAWPALTYRLGCGNDFSGCPGRIVEIARIAQAAADGNPQPMKAWLDKFDSNK